MLPNRIALRSCDRYFEAMLRAKKGGSIHSIFQSAINFQAEGELFTILSGSSPSAPYTGNVKEALDFTTLGLKPSEPVRVNASVLSLSPLVEVSLAGRKLVELKREQYPFSSALSQALHIFDQWVKEQKAPRGCLYFYQQKIFGKTHPPNLLADMTGQRIEAWLACLRPENPAMPQLKRLLGAGEGLTPAGDDFFCGVYAALDGLELEFAAQTALSLRQALAPEITVLSTTDVSKQMIKAQLEGLMSAAHSRFKEAMLCNPAKLREALSDLEQMGYSSGLDFAVGMAVAIRHILEMK